MSRLTLYECVVNVYIQRQFLIRNWTIKPLSGLFISSAFEGWGAGAGGGLIKTGGLFEKGGSFNLEMMMQVSVLHRELEYKEEKLGYKKF